MAAWFGKPHGSRGEVVKYFHAYIKEHDLKVWMRAYDDALVTPLYAGPAQQAVCDLR